MVTEKNTKTVQWVDWPIFPPNHLWQYFADKHPIHFKDLTRDTPNFWRSAPSEDPKLHNHPMLGIEGWREIMTPIVIHGDGGAFTRGGNNLLCYSWASLLFTGTTWESKYLLAAIPKACLAKMTIHGVDTLKTLWAYFVLFFNAMFAGIHPSVDPWGNEWPVGSLAHTLRGKPFVSTFRAVVPTRGNGNNCTFFSFEMCQD